VTILVIDDEPVFASVVAEALRIDGNQVTVAHGGEEGLRAIEQHAPDAVFLDIAMPGMDGIEVLRRIRGRHADLPVIILTGWASERQIAEARRLGVTDILEKPVPLKSLTEALARSRPS